MEPACSALGIPEAGHGHGTRSGRRWCFGGTFLVWWLWVALWFLLWDMAGCFSEEVLFAVFLGIPGKIFFFFTLVEVVFQKHDSSCLCSHL